MEARGVGRTVNEDGTPGKVIFVEGALPGERGGRRGAGGGGRGVVVTRPHGRHAHWPGYLPVGGGGGGAAMAGVSGPGGA